MKDEQWKKLLKEGKTLVKESAMGSIANEAEDIIYSEIKKTVKSAKLKIKSELKKLQSSYKLPNNEFTDLLDTVSDNMRKHDNLEYLADSILDQLDL